MALINTERKFIYLFEPNTRSTLVENALKDLPGSTVIEGDRYKNIAALLAADDITLEQALSYRIVCTVRNPYDSFIARYKQVRPGLTTSNFLSDIQLSRRHPMVLQPGDGMYEEATDFVWFEFLIRDILDLFGVTIARPKRTHRSGDDNKSWHDYYEGKPFRHLLKPSAACQRYMRRFGYRITRNEDSLTARVLRPVRDSFVSNRIPI